MTPSRFHLAFPSGKPRHDRIASTNHPGSVSQSQCPTSNWTSQYRRWRMWIRDVDFSEELIEAHRTGKLVVFVGAGGGVPLRGVNEGVTLSVSQPG
jgi:hypothetical protein